MTDPIFDNVEQANTVEEKLRICTHIITEELAKLLPWLPEQQKRQLRETVDQILKVDFIYRKHIAELQTMVDQLLLEGGAIPKSRWEN